MQKKTIQQILESINKDILNDEVKQAIVEAFNSTIEENVKAKIDLEVKNELTKMDKDHAEKVQKLLESIDADHTNKFKAAMAKVDKDHTAKLKKVIEKYDGELQKGAEALREELSTKISNFLDLYLEKAIPTSQLKEAVENIRARKLIEEIKKVVSVDEEFVNENFKTALKDGHSTIETLREEVNAKIKENIDLNQKLQTAQATLLLEQKTIGLGEEKKKFIYKLLEGKDTKYINANYNYVMEMFEKDDTEKREVIAESAKGKSKTLDKKVDSPKSTVKESIQPNQSNDVGVTDYLKALERE